MQPDKLRFGGGVADTILHPVIAIAMLVAALLILVLPRNKAVVPFLVAFFNIPLGQVVVVAGIHFPVLRILILVVLARMALLPDARRKFVGGFTGIDRVAILWTLCCFVMFFLQFPRLDAVVAGVGGIIDSLGGFIAVRYLIPDRDTILRALKAYAVVTVIQGAFMASEQYTHQNVMEFAGGLPPNFREDHIRSQGTMGFLFGGAFAGVLVPLFAGLWKERGCKWACFAGMAGATTMVWASHASTSALAYTGALASMAFWPMRKSMRLFRWALVATLIVLHLSMNGPVWSLIAKIDVTGGSNGWQRFYLVDMTIRHFRDWWMIGSPEYTNWGWGAWDLCNQFVVAALTGGLLSLVLYIMIFTRSLAALGLARKRVQGDRGKEWRFWCLGSSFVAIIVSSFGINYMIQLQLMLWSLTAFVSITCEQPPPEKTLPPVAPDDAVRANQDGAVAVAAFNVGSLTSEWGEP